MREAAINRKTSETDIALRLNVDGVGNYEVNTGCGFLDHMLALFSRHGRLDLSVACKGDTYVDDHHISIGDSVQICDGPRVHVHRTGQVENFRLLDHFIYDRFTKSYLLVGCVGEKSDELLAKMDNRKQMPGWL